MKELKVVCGIIYDLDKIFIARRKKGKVLSNKWEFPGGKIEEHESESNALLRELKEELGMNVIIKKKLGYNIHEYNNFTINLVAYSCRFISATYELTDHDRFEWVLPNRLKEYDLTEADIAFVSLLF
ncbi:8-oxo-dGTP diphosphatase [Hyunsoonleella jejuensis]|uniref:8-oxo-dGTP diphosphatase n=1 Tax=Hyunsoonleella jejuensis TaxID=419940 RepID=A0A1H9HA42_9FLAO|nr:(deoxy)nucleoside triphosphate pyrophosphohydrolase [Hyunsoonleella jejuensis]SEQ59200.1 8-oxo-dGTP diphosphatase [Hyunsoonleella jejuensis]